VALVLSEPSVALVLSEPSVALVGLLPHESLDCRLGVGAGRLWHRPTARQVRTGR